MYPSKLPDLFGGQTINLIAKYSSPARGTVYVTGRIGNRRVRYPVRVTLPERESEHAALAPTWARYKIADLSSQQLAADSADKTGFERSITEVAMRYHLVSQYTAFVAVDESRIVGNGQPRRIMQPVELPEGVSYQGIFGEPCVGEPMRIGAWGIDVQETESGKLRVGNVTADSRAAQAGIRKGAVVKRVNGVHDRRRGHARARADAELRPGHRSRWRRPGRSRCRLRDRGQGHGARGLPSHRG